MASKILKGFSLNFKHKRHLNERLQCNAIHWFLLWSERNYFVFTLSMNLLEEKLYFISFRLSNDPQNHYFLLQLNIWLIYTIFHLTQKPLYSKQTFSGINRLFTITPKIKIKLIQTNGQWVGVANAKHLYFGDNWCRTPPESIANCCLQNNWRIMKDSNLPKLARLNYALHLVKLSTLLIWCTRTTTESH